MLNEDPYLVFLRGKIEVAPCLGFDVDPEEINPILKPHGICLCCKAPAKPGRLKCEKHLEADRMRNRKAA